MKTTLLSLLAAAALLASAGQTRTFTGVITDTMCGLDHTAMNIRPDAKCVRDCVKMGKTYKYALHDGKNMYVLSDQKLPEEFAARKVKVTGVLYEKTGIIKVERIEAAK
jgi:hypothetical protein